MFELLRPHLDSYEKLLNWFFLQMDFMLMDIICQRNVFFPWKKQTFGNKLFHKISIGWWIENPFVIDLSWQNPK